MQDNLRNTLIILSAIVIGAIFIHGLWVIRKNKHVDKQPENAQEQHGDLDQQDQKQQRLADDLDPLKREFSDLGFDQDGIGQVRRVNADEREANAASFDGAEPGRGQGDVMPTFSASDTESQNSVDGVSFTAQDRAEPYASHNFSSKQQFRTNQGADNDLASQQVSARDSSITRSSSTKDEVYQAPVYQAPVTQAKPAVVKPAQPEKAVESQAKAKNPALVLDNTMEPIAPIEPQVMVISVVVGQNQLISGAALLPSLLTLGMRYGDMGIFHRHQDNAGNGKVTFSLANMMNPGSFDLDNMEIFATQGVSLFMTLPNPGDAFDVFEQMLSAAKQLAQEFNGQVLDDKRRVMTQQAEQHYMSSIRDYERKTDA